VFIAGRRVALALYRSRENSALKIQSFLVSQMLQAINMIISMKKRNRKFFLYLLKIWVTVLVVITEASIESQHALAKLQRKKR
jgi:hypothetical protein